MGQGTKSYPSQAPFTVKMGIFLLMLTVSLLFGALTFAFIFKGSPVIPGISYTISLPFPFYLSTLALLGSSICLHWALQRKDPQDQRQGLKYGLWCGLVFLGIQAWGTYQLFDFQQLFAIEVSQKFSPEFPSFLPFQYIYLLTGMHALHLIAGMGFLGYVFTKWPVKSDKYLEVAVYFWHFLGILWLFLLAVLVLKMGG